ncbi:unnamed protein product [marine sediment metagenome]|uniref:Uncharacterized protein n=1 Tax=marine sediment metagenome TaxID=412755 RepID=X1D637_9ZZZZ
MSVGIVRMAIKGPKAMRMRETSTLGILNISLNNVFLKRITVVGKFIITLDFSTLNSYWANAFRIFPL